MATVPIFTLGVFGYAKISNIQVLLTSGNVNRDFEIPYITPMSLPPPSGTSGALSRSRVTYAEGTIVINGNLTFDVNEEAMTLLDINKLFKRGYQFPLQIFDSEKGYEVSNCFVQSLNISGASEGILTASMSFLGGPRTGKKENIDFRQITVGSGSWSRDDSPIGYWASGNANVRDWSFTMNQTLEPIFLNGINDTDDRYPRYIKVGQITYSLEVTTYEQIYEHKNIIINTKNFTLIGNTISEGYTFGGASDIGTFNHTFETGIPFTNTNGSAGVVITQ